MIQIGTGLRNGISRWKNKHRDCPYITRTGRCLIGKRRDCNRRTCKLIKRAGRLKIDTYLFPTGKRFRYVIFREDVLFWFKLFILDFDKKTEIIISKKDWEKIDRLSNKNKTLAILDLFKRRFKNNLRSCNVGHN